MRAKQYRLPIVDSMNSKNHASTNTFETYICMVHRKFCYTPLSNLKFHGITIMGLSYKFTPFSHICIE